MSNATQTRKTAAKATETVRVIDVDKTMQAAGAIITGTQDNMSQLAKLPEIIANNKVFAARALAQVIDAKDPRYSLKSGKLNKGALGKAVAEMVGISRTQSYFYVDGAIAILDGELAYETTEPTDRERKLANVAWLADAKAAKAKRDAAKADKGNSDKGESDTVEGGAGAADSDGSKLSAQDDFIAKLTEAVRAKVALAKLGLELDDTQQDQVAELVAALSA